jgi:hypothetical protein
MQVVYKKTIGEKIIEAKRQAEVEGKEIDHITLSRSEAKELYFTYFSRTDLDFSMRQFLRGSGVDQFLAEGRGGVYGIPLRWPVEEEEF